MRAEIHTERVCRVICRTERGFTFIEIMVVVAILAILAALVVPRIMGRTDDAKRTAATNRMIELVAKSWIAVPIIEGLGTWAVNPKGVGYFKPIPGRHEFGDVTERMPRPEQRPWP